MTIDYLSLKTLVMNFFMVAFTANMCHGVTIGISYESLAKECREQHAVFTERNLSFKKCLAHADGKTCEEEKIEAEDAWMEYSNTKKQIFAHLAALKDFEAFANKDPLKEEYEKKEDDIYWRRFKAFWAQFFKDSYSMPKQCKKDAACSRAMKKIDSFVSAPRIDDRFDREFTVLQSRLDELRNDPSLPYWVRDDMTCEYRRLSQFTR